MLLNYQFVDQRVRLAFSKTNIYDLYLYTVYYRVYTIDTMLISINENGKIYISK